MNRRHFIGTSILGLGAVAALPRRSHFPATDAAYLHKLRAALEALA